MVIYAVLLIFCLFGLFVMCWGGREGCREVGSGGGDLLSAPGREEGNQEEEEGG